VKRNIESKDSEDNEGKVKKRKHRKVRNNGKAEAVVITNVQFASKKFIMFSPSSSELLQKC